MALSQLTYSTKSWASLLLMVALALMNSKAVAQSAKKPKSETLPSPQPTLNAQGLQQQEFIPITQPENAGDIVVEEEGQGLISLKVRDASLKQVIAMIAETQRVNIIFSAEEDVKVTGGLIRVPWHQALEALLSSTGHTWTKDEGIIVVTTLAAAETIAPRAGGRRVESFELDFARAVDVDQTVQGLLSPAGKSWVMSSSDKDNRQTREVVAVFDFPGNLQQVADYICQIDQPPRQVLIKANILQVNLDDDCRSGVNLQQLISFSNNELEFSTVGLANPAASTASFLQLTGGSLDGLIELLKTTTDAKSLASSELMTVSGQEARLQSGQQLGFRITTTTQTSTLESVEFIDVGVVLSMTPHVTRDGRVLMRIKPEVSEGQIDPDTGLPAEDTVEVETDVLLNDGQGLVIGGLIQEIDSNVQSKVPWLGDIPYAGVLFQKRQLIKSRAEIIVTLIPHVMPYTPIVAAHNDHRVMRTNDLLLSPPLNRFPRPYEPQLPDTFTNPTPIFWRRYVQDEPEMASVTEEAVPLPSFEVTPPAIQQDGPQCYPPPSSSPATPVTQQAIRKFPTHR